MTNLCETCKHRYAKKYMEPCRVCGDGINWEPKDDKRPDMLQGVVKYYDHEISRYPDSVRVSFKDGHTAVYDLRVEQPAPVFEENIQITRKWRQGYVNQPRRRRNRT
ncbi:MAG: hypothetical protein J6U01_05745 [Clostridia bacterium]|nr:hypothetical protein [Clostridia bacterium]